MPHHSKLYNTTHDIDIKNWRSYGLRLPSIIRVHKIASIEKNMIDIKLGEVDSAIKIEVGNLFKTLIK